MPIRPLTPADAEAYIALRREMLADSPWAFASSAEDDIALKPDHLRLSLGHPPTPTSGYAIIGAFDEHNRLLGAAGIMRERHRKMAHTAHVWGVYVTPSFRGRAHGRLAFNILSFLIAHAGAWPGIARLTLSVSENSPAARLLYESLGFIAWGAEPDCLRTGGRSFAETHMYRPL